jgi:hypothetical protein
VHAAPPAVARAQRHSAQDIIKVRSSQMTRISSWTNKLLKLLIFLSDDLPDLFKYWSAVAIVVTGFVIATLTAEITK